MSSDSPWYMETDNAFFQAWYFLVDHPIFRHHHGLVLDKPFFVSRFADQLDIHVARVNPETKEVDDDESKNTHVEIWLEHGPWMDEYTDPVIGMHFPGQCSHDWHLDCGGDTFESAIIALADKVRRYYNDDGTERETLDAE